MPTEYAIKICQKCGNDYRPASGHQKYCSECGPEVKKGQARQAVARYSKKHPEETNAKSARWRKANPEKVRLINARCHKEHPEDPEKNHQRAAAWVRANPERHHASNVAWRKNHPEQVDVLHRKSKAKRRVLGFVPLNQPFIGCDGHHINQSDVIYIPKDLHMSIRHNVFTGKNMEQINALALSFMGGGNA